MFVEVHFVFHMVLETRPPKGKKMHCNKGTCYFPSGWTGVPVG